MLPTFLSISHLVVLDRTLYMFIISLLYSLLFNFSLCLMSSSLFVWMLLAFSNLDCILLLVIAFFETVILFFNLKTDSIFLMFLVFFLMLIVFFL